MAAEDRLLAGPARGGRPPEHLHPGAGPCPICAGWGPPRAFPPMDPFEARGVELAVLRGRVPPLPGEDEASWYRRARLAVLLERTEPRRVDPHTRQVELRPVLEGEEREAAEAELRRLTEEAEKRAAQYPREQRRRERGGAEA